MKPLSTARLRGMASGLRLELEDEELSRLLPMVQDLFDVGQSLRHQRSAGIDRERPRKPVAQQFG